MHAVDAYINDGIIEYVRVFELSESNHESGMVRSQFDDDLGTAGPIHEARHTQAFSMCGVV